MNKYQINIAELNYLSEMIQYLSEKENELSKEGAVQLRTVFDKIRSRPVLDIEIDPEVFNTPFEDAVDLVEEMHNDHA